MPPERVTGWDSFIRMMMSPTEQIPERAAEILQAKHVQWQEGQARIRELEAALKVMETERDNWRDMFHMRVELSDLAMKAALEQDERNQQLRHDLFMAKQQNAPATA